ncbi:MAG: hypothetical protein B6D55_08445 [Candidatus Omnitrophica bacterium 4484_70.2]|nr:MAG: hypothetical protein B6D55_08445 [Candidatus Omnitrophica bacterium 4484_70.2]
MEDFLKLNLYPQLTRKIKYLIKKISPQDPDFQKDFQKIKEAIKILEEEIRNYSSKLRYSPQYKEELENSKKKYEKCLMLTLKWLKERQEWLNEKRKLAREKRKLAREKRRNKTIL